MTEITLNKGKSSIYELFDVGSQRLDEIANDIAEAVEQSIKKKIYDNVGITYEVLTNVKAKDESERVLIAYTIGAYLGNRTAERVNRLVDLRMGLF